MRAILSAFVVAGLLAAAPARAQDVKAAEPKPAAADSASSGTAPAEKKTCEVPADLLPVGDSKLEKVAAAIKTDGDLAGEGACGFAHQIRVFHRNGA